VVEVVLCLRVRCLRTHHATPAHRQAKATTPPSVARVMVVTLLLAEPPTVKGVVDEDGVAGSEAVAMIDVLVLLED
jgi:hypothetical protein